MDAHVAATSATVASAGIGIAAFWASVRGVNAPPMVDASAPRGEPPRGGRMKKMRAQRLSVAARGWAERRTRERGAARRTRGDCALAEAPCAGREALDRSTAPERAARRCVEPLRPTCQLVGRLR